VAAPATATFKVVATGTSATFTYQWYVGGVAIPSATAASYTTSATSISMSGNSYTVTVSNGVSPAATSTAAVLTVTNTAASITTEPLSQTVVAPATATFTVAAAGYPANFTYQWNLGGTAITGATSATYTTPATTVAMSGDSYTVTVSNGTGTPVTSTPAILTVNASAQPLSPDQTVFEGFTLDPASSNECYYVLPYTGSAVSGTDYLDYNTLQLTASPSTSTQQVTNSALADIATIPIPSGYIPDRYLVNGIIYLSSGPAWIRRFSYPSAAVAGITGGVQVDLLDSTGSTTVVTYLNSGYSQVSLTGAVTAAPTDFVNFFSPLFYNATPLVNPAANWASGAAYEKFTSTFVNDTYFVFDYSTTQTASLTPLPAAANTTLAAAITATAGIHVSSDDVTYTLANGSIATINGVSTCTASVLRPNGPTIYRTTPAYITFYQLTIGGVTSVYLGEVIKAGTVSGGNPYAPAPGQDSPAQLNYTMQYQLRLNNAAVTSLTSAVTF
jgi:hypothetical protein